MTRRQFVYVLLVLSLASFLVALVLAHVSSFQTMRGEKSTDLDDPDAPTEPTSVSVECASAASGPLLTGDGDKRGVEQLEDGVPEDDGFTLGREGISTEQVSDACGRIRTERLTHAGELGFLGLLLGGSALLLVRDGRRRPEDATPKPPPPSREERSRGVL